MSDNKVNPDACRLRQRRLQDVMAKRNLDAVVLTSTEHVQYFVGPRFAWIFQPTAIINNQGRVLLVAPESSLPNEHAADVVVPYEAQWHATLRNDQRHESTKVALANSDSLRSASRIGVEYSQFSCHFQFDSKQQLIDVEPDFLAMRRCKDPDEIEKIEKAIQGTSKMYERAREIIRPGVTELEVFNELQAAAVTEFGEMLTGTGNDYQCGAPGGAPRNRRCEAGELYILDLGPAYRGYFADNARTIAVSDVNEKQFAAWEAIMNAFEHVEAVAQPGKSCKELFHEVQAILDQAGMGEFNHHLGHGIGLFPHEGPHLNPHWDDTFQIGDVFTVEPGLYSSDLRAGMRIENNYLVTEVGIRKLTEFPLDLKV